MWIKYSAKALKYKISDIVRKDKISVKSCLHLVNPEIITILNVEVKVKVNKSLFALFIILKMLRRYANIARNSAIDYH